MDRIKVAEVWWGERNVGRLTAMTDGLCAFEYSPQFVADGVSISPYELPLRSGVFVARRSPFDGGFGVFDDSLPDGWGLLLLDRYLRRHGINLRSLTLVDRLTLVGSTGRGALEFRPDQSIMPDLVGTDFGQLATDVEKIFSSDDYLGDGIEVLYRKGGSPGGARPKIFVHHDGREWLVKFPAKYDRKDIGRIEYEYSLLAHECGIEMPPTLLFEGKYFGVERFDRTPAGKLHVISMAGAVCADYRVPCIDYLHIFQVCQQLTHDMREMWKVYRLMAFNYLIGNKDDHAKNFAFIYRDNGWYFAPAFDLLPSEGMNGYHTTSINDSIEPTDSDIISLAVKVGLNKEKAMDILNEISGKVRLL